MRSRRDNQRSGTTVCIHTSKQLCSNAQRSSHDREVGGWGGVTWPIRGHCSEGQTYTDTQTYALHNPQTELLKNTLKVYLFRWKINNHRLYVWAVLILHRKVHTNVLLLFTYINPSLQMNGRL